MLTHSAFFLMYEDIMKMCEEIVHIESNDITFNAHFSFLPPFHVQTLFHSSHYRILESFSQISNVGSTKLIFGFSGNTSLNITFNKSCRICFILYTPCKLQL